jgi:hypothetical protein
MVKTPEKYGAAINHIWRTTSARAKQLHALVKEIDAKGETAHAAPAGHNVAGPVGDCATNERSAIWQNHQQNHQQNHHLAFPVYKAARKLDSRREWIAKRPIA